MINYGVIVGRFQVDELHPGHLELFRQVSALHERVIVFVGVPRTMPTKRNPLDFEVRKKMIQHDYPDFIVLPLRDEKSDHFWSKNLDQSISSVASNSGFYSVTLYGGRDSFVPHYFGKHQVHQLNIPSPTSGTEIREKLSNHVMESKQFRAGAIYAAFNQFPRTLMTVDVAICQRKSDHDPIFRVLLGRKPGEAHYRFIGGFVESGATLEETVRKEAYEETNLDLYSLEYLKSYQVDDWRYQQDPDAKITTAFFIGWTPSQGAKAGDDIEEVKWFDSDKLPDIVEPGHMSLLATFKEQLPEIK
jgi:bifunctional NMN adenylyltransferase/nudix hydrolase